MGIERIEQIKKRKPFALADVFVYAALAVLIVVLFIVFVFSVPQAPIKGVQFVYREQVVYTYSFETGGKAATGWSKYFEERTEGDLVYVTFYEDEEKTEYNVLCINLKEQSAKMTDTNCSHHKDCVYMDAIQSQNGVIICVPHGLKVLALDGEQDFDKPILG